MWAAVFFYASPDFMAMQVFYFLTEGKVKAWSLRTQFAGLTGLIMQKAVDLASVHIAAIAQFFSRCIAGIIARVAEPKANRAIKPWLILSEALSFSTR